MARNASRRRSTSTGNEKAATLQRETFRTSRLLDFCSEKELTAQVGHGRKDWPLVALKELLDNALDSCEEAGTPPQITVTVDNEGITLADNGPGIPETTISAILDFSIRVSSREAYVSPTRGAQGNALKTLLAMPFVLDGSRGRVDIASQGQRHEITFAVDRIRQQPVVSKGAHRADVRIGTSVSLRWPDSACSELREAEARFLQLADDYTFLNPHLSLTVDWFGRCTTTEATEPGWVKWLPSSPTSPHWYGQEELERLLSAYVALDQDRGADRYVRDVIVEFRGLSGSAKQKAVLDATGLVRTPLSALVTSDGLQHDRVAQLLSAMKEESKRIKPEMLGLIGKEHLAKRFEAAGCVMESFTYKRKLDHDEAGLPEVVECAFGWRGENAKDRRRIVTGVNWSPGIVNPFRKLGTSYGDGLAALLEKQYAGASEPVIFLLHVACPRVQYTDRGKSAVVVSGDGNGGDDDGCE